MNRVPVTCPGCTKTSSCDPQETNMAILLKQLGEDEWEFFVNTNCGLSFICLDCFKKVRKLAAQIVLITQEDPSLSIEPFLKKTKV
jgi:hypothetical protein